MVTSFPIIMIISITIMIMIRMMVLLFTAMMMTMMMIMIMIIMMMLMIMMMVITSVLSDESWPWWLHDNYIPFVYSDGDNDDDDDDDDDLCSLRRVLAMVTSLPLFHHNCSKRLLTHLDISIHQYKYISIYVDWGIIVARIISWASTLQWPEPSNNMHQVNMTGASQPSTTSSL